MNLTQRAFIASGWTKAVYRGRMNGQNVAIKTVDVSGHDVSMCRQQYDLTKEQCYNRAAQKILKEIVVLQGLKHPHIIEVRACFLFMVIDQALCGVYRVSNTRTL